MPKPKTGAIVHVEYTSSDLAASRKFFAKAFGWKFTRQPMPPGMEYWTIETPSGPAGGMMAPVPNQPAGTTMSYIEVPSIDRAVAKAEKGGAVVCVPKREVPGAGWFSIVQVPGDVEFAFWESAPPPRRARGSRAH